MNEKLVCKKCGFEFKDEAHFLFDLSVKWGYWNKDYHGKYTKVNPTLYPDLSDTLRCKCERCGYQWLHEPADALEEK